MGNDTLQNLGGRGEKLLKSNLVDDKEKILVKLKGSFGEALVITDKRLYVLKWGLMAGNFIGGRCTAFEFRNITGLEIKKNLMTGIFEVLTPATHNTQKGYWRSGSDDAIKSDNVITFQRHQFHLFQESVKIGRGLINKHYSGDSQETSQYGDLEKLAELKDKGIISEDEFNAKKKSILAL